MVSGADAVGCTDTGVAASAAAAWVVAMASERAESSRVDATESPTRACCSDRQVDVWSVQARLLAKRVQLQSSDPSLSVYLSRGEWQEESDEEQKKWSIPSARPPWPQSQLQHLHSQLIQV